MSRNASSSFDLRDPAAVRDLFREAADLNRSTPGRRGSTVELPDAGRLVVTGDLHDHPDHLEKILKLGRINYSENYHLLLQEVIHGEHLVNRMDFSYRGLARIAELKILRPDQVHHVLSNHELAQLRGEGIVKEGVSVVEAFDEGLAYAFGEEAEKVRGAIAKYLRSLPLAVRTASGLLCAHSLPGEHKLGTFDPAVLERELTDADLSGPDGSAYLMVWGRNLTDALAERLAERWGVSFFVLGHQHVEMGWETIGRRILILNSDHAHGVALPVDLSRPPHAEELTDEILPLAGVL